MRWGQFIVGRRLKLWVCWMMFVDVWRLAWLGIGKQRYLIIVELHYIALGYPEHSLVIIVYHKELDSV